MIKSIRLIEEEIDIIIGAISDAIIIGNIHESRIETAKHLIKELGKL
ncbi:hypothetical protein [Bacillus infantis]|nr:hypothetical protein [Bacillus infantis]MCP1159330.1 hypothetical protein [Bacillus infantis]